MSEYEEWRERYLLRHTYTIGECVITPHELQYADHGRHAGARNWMVCDDDGILCICVYKRGAFAVAEKIKALRQLAQGKGDGNV